jgi:hypothetical protein
VAVYVYMPTSASTVVLHATQNVSLYYKLCGVYRTLKVTVKVTLVQALRFCTGRTVHRGSRGIALVYRH